MLGLVMVYSASQITALQMSLPGSYFFRKQLLAAVIGGILLYAASRMPVRLHRALAYPILAGAVFLMALVQVPGIGMSVNGNQNWISLGGSFQIQPSEFGKLALVLWGADLIARKQEKKLLNQWKHMLVPLVPVAFMLLGLIMLGGDMGTAIILTAILFGLLWLAGAPTRLFVGVLSVAALIGVILIKTSPNRMARLACIGATEPRSGGADCWQAVHGIYALASGGNLRFWPRRECGKKWGQLPEAHTDFIFAVTGEELGLAGTLSVLALFAALGYAGIRVAGRTEDPFVRYAAGGVTTWITAQSVINIGAVLGLLPIAGVPLPLFSYGGSALLPTMFAIGLMIAFARDEPGARAALAMRQPRFGRKRGGRGALRGPGDGTRCDGAPRRRVRPESGEFRCMSYSPAGGTAGHIEPALALADALRRQDPTVGITALGTERGLETKLVPQRGYELALIPAVPLPRKPTPELITVPGRLRGTIKATEQILERTKADVVVGFGGYVALPGYLAAKRLGVPIVGERPPRPRQQDRLPVRRPGRRLHPRQQTAQRPLHRHPAAPLHRHPGPGRRPPRGPRDVRARPQSAHAAGIRWLAGRPPPQRGRAAGRALAATGRHPDPARGRPEERTAAGAADAGNAPYIPVSYLDRMDLAYAAADMMLCRAGAMTVAELSAVGLPAAYVPLPIGNGEQRLNAQPVVKAGGGLLVDDADLTPEWVQQNVLPVLADPHRLYQMSRAAAEFGRRDADDLLVGMVYEAIASRR
ncbi:hypothetical protein GCM10020256_57850 [Streptomyces thermocoprophilus]